MERSLTYRCKIGGRIQESSVQSELLSTLSPKAVFSAVVRSRGLTGSLVGGRAGVWVRDTLAHHTQRVPGLPGNLHLGSDCVPRGNQHVRIV